MRLQGLTTIFLFASLPLSGSAVPSMPTAATHVNTPSVLEAEPLVFQLSDPTETALLEELENSTPHNQNEIARKIATQGEWGQQILLRFVNKRPIYLSQAINYLNMEREDTVASIQSLARTPRPEWGHDVHRFISRQSPKVLKGVLQQQANGSIAPYHAKVIFEYAKGNGIDALNQALGNIALRSAAIENIATAQIHELVPRVAHLLRDGDTNDHVKVECLRALEQFNHPAVIRAIDTALEDESHAVVNQALLSIAENGTTRQHETLRKMLNDGNLNKSYVIRALGVSLDPVSVAMLENAFITGTPEEKYAVLEAMSRSTHKDAVRLLVTASMESNTAIGAKARSLLTQRR